MENDAIIKFENTNELSVDEFAKIVQVATLARFSRVLSKTELSLLSTRFCRDTTRAFATFWKKSATA